LQFLYLLLRQLWLYVQQATTFQQKKNLEQVIPYNNLPSKELPIVQNDAFKEGEILSYRLHYGAMDAGVILMEVKPEVLEVCR
jgi:uncharacterized protein YijF (DUF1287 family)